MRSIEMEAIEWLCTVMIQVYNNKYKFTDVFIVWTNKMMADGMSSCRNEVVPLESRWAVKVFDVVCYYSRKYSHGENVTVVWTRRVAGKL